MNQEELIAGLRHSRFNMAVLGLFGLVVGVLSLCVGDFALATIFLSAAAISFLVVVSETRQIRKLELDKDQ